jgi:hypothetical protein
MPMLSRESRVAVAVLCALMTFACSDDKGTSPTPTAAAPTPSPTPTPTPTPSPVATTKACTLPEMGDCGAGCCRRGGAAQFDAEIEAAQEALVYSSPQLFDANGRVKVEAEEYTAALAKKITEMTGLCARGGGKPSSISGDEVAVKRDNTLSQNVDVLISNGVPWIGERFTCTPASF